MHSRPYSGRSRILCVSPTSNRNTVRRCFPAGPCLRSRPAGCHCRCANIPDLPCAQWGRNDFTRQYNLRSHHCIPGYGCPSVITQCRTGAGDSVGWLMGVPRSAWTESVCLLSSTQRLHTNTPNGSGLTLQHQEGP